MKPWERIKTKTKESKPQNVRGVFLFLAFFAPMEMMLLIYARNIIYPFGDRSFLISDLYHQYMPFFQEFVEKIKAGENLTYSWNIGLGSNFFAIYGYYLSSPLYWLVLVLPASASIEIISYLVIVKIGIAGGCAFLYLDGRSDLKNTETGFFALVFSSFYAMSGYVAAYNYNVIWLDAVALAPLVLLGLERLVKKGKMGLYVVALAICILSNFYLSIFLCIFLVFYFVFKFITETGKLRMLWQFALGSLLGGGLAGVILIPECFALLGTDLAREGFPKAWDSYFSILEVLARHCMNLTPSQEAGQWPNIYCGCAVFILIPLYAVNKGIPLKKRVGMLALAAFLLLSFETNVLDYLWHGLGYPRGFPARQAFLYILLILSMCQDLMTHVKELPAKAVFQSWLGAVCMLLFVEKFLQSDDFHAWDWLKTLAFATAYFGFLYYYVTRSQGSKIRDFMAMLCYVLVLTECTINMATTSVQTMDRGVVLRNVEETRTLYARNSDAENAFTRFESSDHAAKNFSAMAGYPSASVFSSVLNGGVREFYSRMGMRNSRVYYEYEGATELDAALLNVGYTFAEKEGLYSQTKELADQENGVFLYRSKESLPFGYVAPEGFELSLDRSMDGIELQNDLCRQLGIQEALFEEQETKTRSKSVSFTPERDGVYYGLLQCSDVSEVKLTVDGENVKTFPYLTKGSVLTMGELKEGAKVTLSFDLKNEEDQSQIAAVKKGDVKGSETEGDDALISVYQLNLNTLSQAIKCLGENHLRNLKVQDARVSGELEIAKAGRVILTIPYDRGWKLKVNGNQMEPSMFGGAFLAIDLEPGTHEIVLKYAPPGVTAGILITLTSLLIFLGICLPGLVRSRQKARKD